MVPAPDWSIPLPSQRRVTTAPERLTTVLADGYRGERPLGQGGMGTVYAFSDSSGQ